MTSNNAIRYYLAEGSYDISVGDEVVKLYNLPTKHYHNSTHVMEMLGYVNVFFKNNKKEYDEKEFLNLCLAIVFHDVIYDPKRKDNEEQSAIFFEEHSKHLGKKRIDRIKHLIMLTKTHDLKEDMDVYEKLIIKADLDRFNGDFVNVWGYTKQLFNEYIFVDWSDFKKGRLEFLKSYKHKISKTVGKEAGVNVGKIATALSVWEPKIGVFAGSFDPFHIGHLNILEKAEQIFDKVIVVQAQNPTKGNNAFAIPDFILETRQVEYCDGLLTDYLKSKDYPVTLIRGLRNSTDLQYEIVQNRYFKDFMPDIKTVNIVCDKEFEHVSSSAIKSIKALTNEKTKYEL